MTITLYRYKMSLHPHKRIRRNATAVMAGLFDPPPPRDVLTSLLNGVPRYKEVEGDELDEEAKAKRKQEKKDIKREEKRKAKAAARSRLRELKEEQNRLAATDPNFASTSALPHPPPAASRSTTSFWAARPTISIPKIPRSVSVTPSPTHSHRKLSSTPASTPGPSISSSTSRTSSKRPHTPDDDDHDDTVSVPSEVPVTLPRPRKKRAAAKKGWKGWVEGSPPPSDKLINLDHIVSIQERRTRSGRNFDGIVGNQSWKT